MSTRSWATTVNTLSACRNKEVHDDYAYSCLGYTTRIFHWLLVGSFAGAFLATESETYRDAHVALGYLLLALIGFRVIRGLIGTRYACFRSFAFGPSRVLAYLKSVLRGSPFHYTGHNPGAAG